MHAPAHSFVHTTTTPCARQTAATAYVQREIKRRMQHQPLRASERQEAKGALTTIARVPAATSETRLTATPVNRRLTESCALRPRACESSRPWLQSERGAYIPGPSSPSIFERLCPRKSVNERGHSKVQGACKHMAGRECCFHSPDPTRRGGKVSLLTITFELLKRDSAGTDSLLFRQELPLPPQQQAMIKSKTTFCVGASLCKRQLTSKEVLCSWDAVSRCEAELM